MYYEPLNLQINFDSRLKLYRVEVDILIMVIQETLASFSENPDKGTCIVYGQRYNEEADLLVRFNLPGGPSGLNGTSSDTLAEKATRGALSFPSQDSPYIKLFGSWIPPWLNSGIFQVDELKVLVLNAKVGRFIASFYGGFENGGHEENIAVLMAIAEAFAQMSREDSVLNDSAGDIALTKAEFGGHAVGRIVEMFNECSAPAIRVWKTHKECRYSVHHSEEPILFLA